MNNNVSLICLSQPSAQTDCNNAEELIAYIARVSNPKNQGNKSTAAKLVNYLVENHHWSPLEMVHMTLEFHTTRDIGRQILRHRSFSFQEFSQRYATLDELSDMEFANREARLQDTKNRQNSIEIEDKSQQVLFDELQHQVSQTGLQAYQTALGMGIAKEQARVFLPEGLTPSKMYMAGNIRSWLHYCQLRMGNGTQKEHKMLANECWLILDQHFPSITRIFHPHIREIQKELIKYHGKS